MTNNLYIPLPHRNVISVSGADKVSFMQGLVTNDVTKINKENAIYALMLTPQGKFLYDFFISEYEDKWLIDCSAEHKPALIKKLTMYKLRSDVALEDVSDRFEVVQLIGENVKEHTPEFIEGSTRPFCKGVCFIDPRNKAIGARSIIEKSNEYQSFKVHDFTIGTCDDYQNAAITNTIPEADINMVSGDIFPLDFNMNELNAVDYKKGCYVGQEVTARTHHRGKRKKFLITLKANENIQQVETGLKIKADNSSNSITVIASSSQKILALLNQKEEVKTNYFTIAGALFKQL